MNVHDEFDTRLLSILCCPRDHSELHIEHEQLLCFYGHNYPIINGIPIFLLREKPQTIGIAISTLNAAHNLERNPITLYRPDNRMI